MSRRWLLAAVVLVAVGCTGGENRARETQAPQEREEISAELIDALGQVKNLHHQADVYLGEGNVEAALAAVKKITEVSFPAGAEEREDVVIEAYARLGTIELGRGAFDDAQAAVEEGDKLATRDTFFRANLHMVLGYVHKGRADSLTDAEAARHERERAIAAFERAMDMDLALQQQRYQERQ